MSQMNDLPPIALGAWAWGSGAAGGDQVFGNHFTAADFRSVFAEAVECGLNLWDTAAVYGMEPQRRYSAVSCRSGRVTAS